MAMTAVGLCVIKKSAKTAKLDNVFEHIFTPRIYQVTHILSIQFRRYVVIIMYATIQVRYSEGSLFRKSAIQTASDPILNTNPNS